MMMTRDILAILAYCLALVTVVSNAADDGLKCIRCDSMNDENPGDCMEYPPQPVICSHIARGRDMYCVIIRHLDRNGELLRFVRDCSMANKGNTCEEVPNAHASDLAQICHSTCEKDGCNAGSGAVSPWVVARFAIALTPTFLLASSAYSLL